MNGNQVLHRNVRGALATTFHRSEPPSRLGERLSWVDTFAKSLCMSARCIWREDLPCHTPPGVAVRSAE